MPRWLEISADYRCNNRCLGCFAVRDDGPSLDTRGVMAALVRARRDGAKSLWLGGGEPTLRKDLFAIVRQARSLGYEQVKLQTNGMLLAYPEFTDRAAAAGVTEVNFSIKGATADTHDLLTRTPGCHELMLKGMAEVRKRGITLHGDYLVYRQNLGEIVDAVRRYFELGVSRFNFWLLSVFDSNDPEVAREVPRISELVPRIQAAMDLGLSDDPEFIVSLHTPACTVAATHRRCVFRAKDLDLLVVDAGGSAFPLEQSPIEGGVYVEGCARCDFRPRCGGLRRDYLELYGDAEFLPVTGTSSSQP